MHLMATFYLVLTDSALSTSENVPSPNFLTSRYSKQTGVSNEQHCEGRLWVASVFFYNDFCDVDKLTVHFSMAPYLIFS